MSSQILSTFCDSLQTGTLTEVAWPARRRRLSLVKDGNSLQPGEAGPQLLQRVHLRGQDGAHLLAALLVEREEVQLVGGGSQQRPAEGAEVGRSAGASRAAQPQRAGRRPQAAPARPEVLQVSCRPAHT